MSKEEATENLVAVVVLTLLTIIYLYILTSPTEEPVVPFLKRQFAIPSDTEANFDKFLESYKKGHDGSSYLEGENDMGNRGGGGLTDDFYFKPAGYSDNHKSMYEHTPNIPSEKFICQEGLVTIRSEANYKYLWLHGNSEQRLSATASQETPLHLRSFKMSPVNSDCSDSGYVTLQSVESDGRFLYMMSNVSDVEKDGWFVKLADSSPQELVDDQRFQFLFEEAGFLLNRAGMTFVNVRYEEDGNLAGGSTNDWDKSQVAGREYGAIVNFNFVNNSNIEESLRTEAKEIMLAKQQDTEEIELIKSFPTSSEKRVISFGLYGKTPKYTHGAVRNAELAVTYFPGWVCRFYVTSDVPADVISRLRELNAEIEHIPDGMGYSSGMFYRFLVAADSTIDRYIIRDADSRLNARDRIAVEEWIESKKPVHILRDHVNHCNTINGGMWGGVMGALPSIAEHVMNWKDRDQYLADINFLDSQVWQTVMDNHIAHDSYCCDKFPLTRPFPSRRPPTYQHVGQVFDAKDQERRTDIEGYIRGVPTPVSCRKNVDWIYG
mmetsp:Transcript_36783/g.68417  ORF Transcript_36783/g.68417 Transcript_36783/m.68417 type:complete len:549 (-) Transcript_36783:26-1672(-)